MAQIGFVIFEAGEFIDRGRNIVIHNINKKAILGTTFDVAEGIQNNYFIVCRKRRYLGTGELFVP